MTYFDAQTEIRRENEEAKAPVDSMVILPPYVAPEHQSLLDEAQSLLNTYSEMLAEKLKPKGTANIDINPEEYERAHREFLTDPFRQRLVANLVHIKSLVERPRMQVKA